MSEPNQCPICGANPICDEGPDSYVWCGNSKCEVNPIVSIHGSLETAIQIWNILTPERAYMAEIVRLREEQEKGKAQMTSLIEENQKLLSKLLRETKYRQGVLA